MRVLLATSISSSLRDILKASVLGARAHIVSLVRLATRNSDRLLQSSKRIGPVEVHITGPIALRTSCPLGFSLLLLLQKSHSYRALLLLLRALTSAHVAEPTTREMALFRTADELSSRAELLICDTETSTRAERLTVLDR